MKWLEVFPSPCYKLSEMEKPSDRTRADEVYWQNLNQMTPAQKLEAFHNLYWTARELKAAGLRMQFPELPEEEIQKKVREIFLYASD